MKDNILILKSIDGVNKVCRIRFINFPVYMEANGYKLLSTNYISDSIMNKLWCAEGKDSIFTVIKGFFRKKHQCPLCANIINVSNLKAGSIITKLCMEKEIFFDFEVSMPMVLCDKCNKKLIIKNQKYSFQMEYAILDAFDKFKIR